MNKQRPPRRALQFLRWFCREDCIEEVEGDLVELYEKRMDQGSRFVKVLFCWNVIQYFRPMFMKAFSGNPALHHFPMRHALLITYRNYLRHKATFVINVIGLALGLTSSLLIFLWVDDEMQVDAFHEKKDRLFEVMSNVPISDTEIMTIGATPGELGPALEEEIPEVEEAVMVALPMGGNELRGIASFQDAKVKASELYVEDDFFSVFSFEVLKGNAQQIFPHAEAVALSDEMARNLFGSADEAIGKSLQWERGPLSGSYIVTGVFANIPTRSSLQFDIVFPYEKYFSVYSENLTNWRNSNPHTFVLLYDAAQAASVNSKLFDFKKEKIRAAFPEADLAHAGPLFIRPYIDRYLFDRYENGIQSGGRISYVRLFSVIAIAMLVVVCINFVNLSIARATHRVKEIGVKKTIGASRRALFLQFIVESVFLSCAALLLALLAVTLVLPIFNSSFGKQIDLAQRPEVIFMAVGIAATTGVFAGLYPAMVLSGFRPLLALRWRANLATGGATLRRALIGVQFAISIGLLTGSIVVYNQIQYIRSKNLGYDRSNVITFKREGKLNNGVETFVNQLKALPGVEDASHFYHDFVGNFGSTSALNWRGKNPERRILFANLEVGHGLIELLNVKVVAGRTFAPEHLSDSSALILNQAAADVMGFHDPVGETVKLWGQEHTVIGVVENFHFESLHQEVRPCFFRLFPKGKNILVKLAPGDPSKSIAAIQRLYRETNDGIPFEFRFLEDDYNAMYASENRVGILATFFGIVTLLVCCLGLFGLSIFVTDQKRKEVAIRKVLGSGLAGLVRLLSSEFFQIALVSSILTVPLCYLLANAWLSNYAYRLSIEMWWLIVPVMVVVVLGFLTISVQTVRAVLSNPVESLRTE